MKRTVSLLLALCAVFSINLSTLALETDNNDNSHNIITEINSGLSLSADENGRTLSGLLTPNQTLRFPILLNGQTITSADLENLRLRIETKDGRSAVSSIRIIEDDNGYVLEIKTLSGYPTNQVTYEGQLTLLNKKTGEEIHRFPLNFSVGYHSVSNEAVESAKDGSYLFVDAETPVITDKQFNEIDRQLNGDKLILSGNGWTYEVRVTEQPAVNMIYNERPMMEIVKQFDGQEFKFLSFPAGPVFDFTGTLSIDVSDVIDEYEELHLYSYYNGKLNKVWTALNEEDETLSFKTKYFGHLVLTDKEIKDGTVIHCEDNTTTPSQPSGDKVNPNTGA